MEPYIARSVFYITKEIQLIQGEHKVFPWLQTFTTRNLRGIQTCKCNITISTLHKILETNLSNGKIYVCIPRSFLLINICNQGKTLCLPCTMFFIISTNKCTYIQSEHKVFPWLQTFTTRNLRGIQTCNCNIIINTLHKILETKLSNGKKYVCIPPSFLLINVCNQGKTLCSPCIIFFIIIISAVHVSGGFPPIIRSL